MRKWIITSMFLLAGLQWAHAQASSRGYFQMTYQNDYFTATDYYFTQGIRLECGAPLFRKSPLANLLLTFEEDSTALHRIFVAQDGYTPTSIRADQILYGDRPYAAALYLGQKVISLDSNRQLKLSSEIQMGVIGPWAFAKEEQEYIHRQTGNVEPMGWQYQIKNDLLLNYNLQLDKQLYHSTLLAVSGGGSVKLGTYRTRVGIQGQIKLGWVDHEFSTRPEARKIRFFLFAKGQLNAIGYDATLQGGLFNRKSVYTIPASDLKRLVADYEIGAQLNLGTWRLVFSHTHITPEFREGRPHAWGTARVRIGF